MSSVGAEQSGSYNIFISYSHADNDEGWVSGLVERLRRSLAIVRGSKDVDLFMDVQQRAPNDPLTPTILDALRSSRVLLIVSSVDHLNSAWCQREVENFLAASAATQRTGNVFMVERHQLKPKDRARLNPSLLEVTALEFWVTRSEKNLKPYVDPLTLEKEDEPLFNNLVNALAHYIDDYLDQSPEAPEASQTVLLAEVTPDLKEERKKVLAALKQEGFNVLPESWFPRDSETFFVNKVCEDLKRAALFVQLLGPYEGDEPSGSTQSMVALQAREADKIKAENGLRVIRWRSRDLDVEAITNASHRELVRGADVRACLIADLIKEVIDSLKVSARPAVTETETPASFFVYVNADQIDREMGQRVQGALAASGFSVLLSPEPMPDQSPTDINRAQRETLTLCDGTVLVYGQTRPSWVQTQFALTARALADKRQSVWGMLLDAPPPSKPDAAIVDKHLLTVDCRNGFDEAKVVKFFERLRAAGGGEHV